MLILSSAIQNVGVQLLPTTSCKAWLVLRGSLPCLSPHPPVFQVLSFHPAWWALWGASGQAEPGGFFSVLTFLPAKPNLACGVAYPSRRTSVDEPSFPSAASFPLYLATCRFRATVLSPEEL